MRSLLVLSLALPLFTACFPGPPDRGGGSGPGGSSPDAASGGGDCNYTTDSSGTTPGFPFATATFDSDILPDLQSGCYVGPACHGPGNSYGFTVFQTGDSDCANVQTFNEVVADADYMNGPDMSRIIQISGMQHLVIGEPLLTNMRDFISAAQQAYQAGDGGGGGGGAAVTLDAEVYIQTIQPLLNSSNCLGSGCHSLEGGALGGDFGLYPNATVGSTELQTNLDNIAGALGSPLPTDAFDTLFYGRATDRHAGAIVSSTRDLQDWIQAALDAAAVR
ncbi:hypothetical protein [Haliangium sp.]|uniref:hypothetical protein n=1 Tax=Haliangium sp. TaxID=2663208 RepID=UPI003D130667